MLFHSTNGKIRGVTFPEAIENGLAEDGGLFMPAGMPSLPSAFFKNIQEMSLQEIGYVVCNTLLGDILSSQAIKSIVDDALDFPVPLRKAESSEKSGVMVPRCRSQVHGPSAARVVPRG